MLPLGRRDLPGVRDVAVVGLPDERWGEVVCAVFVLHPGAMCPEVAQVRGHLATRMAAFKQPRRVAVVLAIPRTAATGQIQRSQVRAEILDSVDPGYQVSPSRQSQVSSAVTSMDTATGNT
jgi:fatty-acyl-CoA synthase